MSEPAPRWDWPHRIWHWSFAIAIVVSLCTGLIGDIDAMRVHVRCGVVVIGLLAFRLGWWLWGTRSVRWREYRVTPARIWRQLCGTTSGDGAHTPAGAAMAIAMFVAAATQAASGLFASDDIATDGPYSHLLDEQGVEFANAIHTRVFWLVGGLAVTHAAAIAWYAFRRDPLAHSMWPAGGTAIDATQHWSRALLTAAFVVGAIWIVRRWA